MKESTKKLIGKWKRKGRFVLYSKDNERFLVPLCFLNRPIFRVLLEMAEEEYGLTVHGPLRVPFEKGLVENILSLLRRNPSEEEDDDDRTLSFHGQRHDDVGTLVLLCR